MKQDNPLLDYLLKNKLMFKQKLMRRMRPEQADDCLQNMCIRLHKYKPVADNPVAFISNMVNNEIFSNYKKYKRSEKLLNELVYSYEPTHFTETETVELSKAMRRLSSVKQEAVKAWATEENLAEYAKNNNVNYNTLKANVRHGLSELKSYFNSRGIDFEHFMFNERPSYVFNNQIHWQSADDSSTTVSKS